VSTVRVIAVIQARMGSSRLPGKVLRPLGGRPVLDWVLRAARSAASLDEVVIATSTAAADDAIADAGERWGCRVVRGSESDVLARFVLAAHLSDADAVVRLTADCPLLDPALIDQVVGVWRSDPTLSYVSTTLVRTLPRGLDVELLTRKALERADVAATAHDRVHVTSWLYREGSPEARAGLVIAPARPDLRVTLDTAEDAEMLDALVALLADRPPSWREVVDALVAHPEVVALNAAVEQKRLEDA
jgi:spore coat polysaccharide biosynthesis protein SpsF